MRLHSHMMHNASTERKCLSHQFVRHLKNMTNRNERLKEAREKAGFTSASDAARAMDMPIATYVQHENGRRGFPVDRAPQYARRFKVSEEWLLYGKGGDKADRAPGIMMEVRLPSEPALTSMFVGMLHTVGQPEIAASISQQLAQLLPGALEQAQTPLSQHQTANEGRAPDASAQPRASKRPERSQRPRTQ